MLSYLSGVNETNLKNNNMNKNDELGIYYPDEMGFSLKKAVTNVVSTVQNVAQQAQSTAQNVAQQAQNAIQTTIKGFQGLTLDDAKHNIAKVMFTVQRGAFLILLRLGGELEKTPIKINIAKEMAKQWPIKGTRIRQRWYDFGGDPQELINIINIASAEPTISGLPYLGEPVTIAAATASATPPLVAFFEILGKAQTWMDDPKNAKTVALGKKIVGKAVDSAKQNNPKEASEIQSIANTVISTLPAVTIPVTPQQVTTAVDETKNAIDTVKSELNPSTQTKDNKMIYIIGGVAVLGLGALFLLKRKK